MTRLLPTPSIQRLVPHYLAEIRYPLASDTGRLAIQAGEKMRDPLSPLYRRSVSFRLAKRQPPDTAYRGVAHTPSSAGSLATSRCRTDEASRPDGRWPQVTRRFASLAPSALRSPASGPL